MGGFACSSWYFLRFTSPHYQQGPFEPTAMRYWMPVDLYVGGAEHAVLHLLYARFWIKVMADAGLVPFREPFAQLMNQGNLLAPDGYRMSKSRGNVITPDSMVEKYGADTLRIYELFMAPFDQDVNWSPEGIMGIRRFLDRLWDLYRETYTESSKAAETDRDLLHLTHKTIRRVSDLVASFKFNIMVAALMEFVNALRERRQTNTWRTETFHRALETLIILLAPSAPHIAEELWHLTNHSGSVHQQRWPTWNAELARDELTTIAIQINGKLRDTLEVPIDTNETDVKERALARPKVQHHLKGQEISKVIYVPGRILNIVTRKPN
jgi:leucyl-tRNA synthetase